MYMYVYCTIVTFAKVGYGMCACMYVCIIIYNLEMSACMPI